MMKIKLEAYTPLSILQIKVWDAQEKKCIGVLMGHTGSVKSVCSHPTNSGIFFNYINYLQKIFSFFEKQNCNVNCHCSSDLVVSGSRDGSFNIWDLRCNNSSKSRNSEVCIG